jgi:Cu2+-exporting ATPase
VNDVDPDGGPLDVRYLGPDRVRIQGAAPGAASIRQLMTWLSERREVLQVSYRGRTGSIEVVYRDEPDTRGAFEVSLRDRVFTLNRPMREETPGLRIEIAHLLEDRARLRFVGATDDEVLRAARWLAAQPAVSRASASPTSHSITVFFDPDGTSVQALLERLSATDPAEWPAAPVGDKPGGVTGAVGRAAFNTAVLATTVSGLVPAPAMAALVALTAIPSTRRALKAAGFLGGNPQNPGRRLSVDVLDVAAIGISLGTGQPATAAFITWLLGVGDLVLERTADRARHAISKLMHLEATEAWRVKASGELERVAPKRLVAGDRIVVQAGGSVAADGIVASGTASIDEKALTGESIPQERKAGDRVLAATVVLEGEIIVEVERAGGDTTAAKIVQILEGAGAKPMTLQRETEKVADRLVLPTFGIAGAAALFASQIDRMTSVLITDFGTGIRIAVPTSALAAMTVAAREGVLVKGAQYLERLAKADAIVFDKTGTLTGGAPEVFEVVSTGPVPAREAMALAAAAETRQTHPVAEAIRRYAERARLDVVESELGSVEYKIGVGLAAKVGGRDVLVGGKRLMQARGIDFVHAHDAMTRHRAAGASTIFVAVDGALQVVIGYADEPRPESRDVVRALQAGGRRKVILMSGDARAPVEAVARAVGVDEAIGELLPEDKARRVRELQRAGKVVAMIGDGINDAPALAVADVGISLHGGTDVALETADVVLLDGGLVKLPHAFKVADDAMRHVRRGLGLVIAPNAVAIVLGAAGLLTPGAAAAVNNGSTVIAALAAISPLLRSGPRTR